MPTTPIRQDRNTVDRAQKKNMVKNVYIALHVLRLHAGCTNVRNGGTNPMKREIRKITRSSFFSPETECDQCFVCCRDATVLVSYRPRQMLHSAVHRHNTAHRTTPCICRGSRRTSRELSSRSGRTPDCPAPPAAPLTRAGSSPAVGRQAAAPCGGGAGPPHPSPLHWEATQ